MSDEAESTGFNLHEFLAADFDFRPTINLEQPFALHTGFNPSFEPPNVASSLIPANNLPAGFQDVFSANYPQNYTPTDAAIEELYNTFLNTSELDEDDATGQTGQEPQAQDVNLTLEGEGSDALVAVRTQVACHLDAEGDILPILVCDFILFSILCILNFILQGYTCVWCRGTCLPLPCFSASS